MLDLLKQLVASPAPRFPAETTLAGLYLKTFFPYCHHLMVRCFDLIKPDHPDQQFDLLRLAEVLAGFLRRGEKQNFVPTVLPPNYPNSDAFTQRKTDFLLNINRGTYKSLSFFCRFETTALLFLFANWHFREECERGPLGLEVRRPPCLAPKAS